ncbi:ABC-type cobalt transport system, ATPase component [Desulfosporosinus youngiae DSM 17734]|uniref:ABC-type cobalt transport system, ATPase component n=2 Tax=Desulfosporosinus TaxID=79206 RepID=H5Y207_9FIRM|nr:ABC-type cobalt transport system, ATPase component [Desulfosporosinus youngiae DSM 17734]
MIMKTMIRVHNLTYTYEKGRPPVLKDINLQIGEGEYIAIIGPNGCGKTTLIRHFNALLLPSAGEVQVGEFNTRETKHLREIRRKVGMAFQNADNQIVGMSVEEDVAFGPGNLGLPSAEVRRRVDQALATAGLTELRTRPPHTLSGGQKQRLALAGLLAMEPEFIVLDEPTASLDPESKKKVSQLLKTLNSQGIGIVHVTHSMDEATLADRVLVLDQGELVADGNPRDILSRVDWLKSLGLAPTYITELMWRLHQAGIDVNTSIFTIDSAVEEIASLLKHHKNSSSRAKLPGKVM